MNNSVDSFAPWQIAREYGLSGVELLVLLAMTIQLNWKDSTNTWKGSIADLVHDTQHSWKAVEKALGRLAEKGLIEFVGEFGHGVKGAVRILVYDRLIVLSRNRRSSREALAPEADDAGQRSAETSQSSDAADTAEIGTRLEPSEEKIVSRSAETSQSSCPDTDPRGKASKVSGTRTRGRARREGFGSRSA